MTDTPVRSIQRSQEKLRNAIDAKSWDEAARIAREVVKLIPLAINKETCKTGRPHLDGVYRVGTMEYAAAPPKVQRYLNMMNNIIKSASKSLPRK